MNCAIYNNGKYGTIIYNDRYAIQNTPKNSYKGILFAHRIRRSISKGVTYRIRYGNGFARSVKGKVYQDRYKYFVPTSIDHPNGEASRQTFKDAVSAWQTLSDNEKKLFNQRATRRGGLAGYHLFIREYMKQNYTGA